MLTKNCCRVRYRYVTKKMVCRFVKDLDDNFLFIGFREPCAVIQICSNQIIKRALLQHKRKLRRSSSALLVVEPWVPFGLLSNLHGTKLAIQSPLFSSDTIITIFSMFSAMKIHISRATQELLEDMHNYNIESRGEIEVKVSYCLNLIFLMSTSVQGCR
jgi:hypothetical protein